LGYIRDGSKIVSPRAGSRAQNALAPSPWPSNLNRRSRVVPLSRCSPEDAPERSTSTHSDLHARSGRDNGRRRGAGQRQSRRSGRVVRRRCPRHRPTRSIVMARSPGAARRRDRSRSLAAANPGRFVGGGMPDRLSRPPQPPGITPSCASSLAAPAARDAGTGGWAHRASPGPQRPVAAVAACAAASRR
jgi:hypothetical protein